MKKPPLVLLDASLWKFLRQKYQFAYDFFIKKQSQKYLSKFSIHSSVYSYLWPSFGVHTHGYPWSCFGVSTREAHWYCLLLWGRSSLSLVLIARMRNPGGPSKCMLHIFEVFLAAEFGGRGAAYAARRGGDFSRRSPTLFCIEKFRFFNIRVFQLGTD